MTPTPPPSGPPKFLDQVRLAAEAHFGRPEPAERCVSRSRRFILFHNKRRPRDMGAAGVVAFLEHLAAGGARLDR
jgi:hypothetical protein